jgi:cytochrome c oxidase accessory protein FixG
VYLELVYRPIERWLDGRKYTTGGRASVSGLRTAVKHGTFVVVSLVLAHTFLSYFVGVDRLAEWMRRSPVEHPTAFLVVAATTGLMLLDFGYLREQVCTLMCPYGRFQSVLLDRDSWIVAYDPRRGEPRAKLRDGQSSAGAGDCIDCHLCVATCPTGIDIRSRLQMECVGCAQCIDACDAVMERIDKPRGLIRYSSEREIGGEAPRRLRPRVLAYPALLALVAVLFGVTIAGRETADVSILRHRSRPYEVLPSGAVANTVLVKVVNRSDRPRTFTVDVPGAIEVASHDLPLRLEPTAQATASLRVVVAADRFEDGRAEIEVRVSDGDGFDEAIAHAVLGPLYGTP